MRLRTQLALAFLALTILPLGGLAGYSYHSSSEAVREALEEDAEDLAARMDAKLTAAREWLTRSVESVEPISLERLADDEDGDQARIARRIITSMGSAAPLVRSFEFIPFEVTSSTEDDEETEATQFQVSTDARSSSLDTVEASPGGGDRSNASVIVDPAPGVAPRVAGTASVPAVPPVSPTPPAPPSPPAFVINIESALETAGVQGSANGDALVIEDSVEMALKTLETLPLDQTARRHAERIAAEADRKQIEASTSQQEKEIEARREAIDRARERLRELSRRHAASRQTHDGDRRVTVFRDAPEIPVLDNGEVVGSVRADMQDESILREIFLSTAGQGDEIPFAIDASGKLYTSTPEEANELTRRNIEEVVRSSDRARIVDEDWIIATRKDPESGLIMGVARPVKEALAEVRKATVRSLALGLALVAVCLVGIMPLANHMTRDIVAVTDGAERISRGDLDTEVPVRSSNEVGRLAAVFNRMAGDLRENQKRLVEEETARREQEIRERLLKDEYARTSSELEDARQFQLAMLPSSLPDTPLVEMAVEMTTATEVGGDFYDFRQDEGGLTIAIGDGTGHGAKAGTMVAVIKSLFTAWRSDDLEGFLRDTSATIRSMQLGRMSMALSLLRIERGTLRCAAAGMPPVLVCRADGSGVSELSTPGAPLGTIEFPYEESTVDLRPGDTIVAMTDGLPELLDPDGEPVGYERIHGWIDDLDTGTPREIIERLLDRANQWKGARPLSDDLTLLVMRYRGERTVRDDPNPGDQTSARRS